MLSLDKRTSPARSFRLADLGLALRAVVISMVQGFDSKFTPAPALPSAAHVKSIGLATAPVTVEGEVHRCNAERPPDPQIQAIAGYNNCDSLDSMST